MCTMGGAQTQIRTRSANVLAIPNHSSHVAVYEIGQVSIAVGPYEYSTYWVEEPCRGPFSILRVLR